jgi:uncharacterized protein (DUF1697 family)
MPRYVALLRAVNVGGAGRLAMATLRALCSEAGFRDVTTYIASGNVVFTSGAAAARVRAALEARLLAHAGKSIAVVLRTAAEMAAVRDANPFRDAPAKHTYVLFLQRRPARRALRVAGQADERVCFGKKEIFVHYPRGMGRSRLRIAAASEGTARNMTTVAKLAQLAAAQH